jgi:hypothetical protein
VLLPIALVCIYFAIVGAFGKFVEAAFVFPLTGVQRGPVTLGHRITRIAGVVHGSYGVSGALLWIGMFALIAVAVVRLLRSRPQWRAAFTDPLLCIILLTLATQLIYAFADFQGYPDVYPLLPYGAIGMGGLAAVVVSAARSESVRNVVTSAVLGLTLVFAAVSWVWFGSDPSNSNELRDQRADACAVQRIAGPTGGIWALGDATPLVLTHRKNPDRYIYLGSAVDRWRIKHTTGGFDAWTAKIQAVHPDVVVISGWHSGIRTRITRWLHQNGYVARFVGPWVVFLTPGAVDAAHQHGVRLDQEPSEYATGVRGHRLAPAPCH